MRILTTSREPLAITGETLCTVPPLPAPDPDHLPSLAGLSGYESVTLRACVDWSFDLCTKPERLLWARLSVFVGGFELDAAEAVCADDKLPEADLLDLVTELLDKSILVRQEVRDGHAETARYRLLETIRDYGRGKLRETGDEVVLRRRHRDWCQMLVGRANAEGVTDRQGYWLARLASEHPNIRTAVEFALSEPSEAQAVLRLAVSCRGSTGPSAACSARASARLVIS